MTREIWKELRMPGLGERTDYFVSNLGRIKSHNRRTGGVLLLKFKVAKRGHHVVNFIVSGQRKMFQVHRLVKTVFSKAPRPGALVCHRDSNPANNEVSNLYWGTYKSNAADRRALGRGVGKTHGRARLNEKQVGGIKRRAQRGESVRSIHADFPQVTHSAVWMIAKGINWKHVSAEVA